MKNNTANNHILKLRQLSKNLKLLKSSNDRKNILLSYTYGIKTKELLSIYQDMNYLKPNEHKSYWEQSDSNYSHITMGINKYYDLEKINDIDTISKKIEEIIKTNCHIGKLPPKIIGGIKFNSNHYQNKKSIWDGQPNGMFIIPEIIITAINKNQFATVICFVDNNEKEDILIKKLSSKIDLITKLLKMKKRTNKNILNNIKTSKQVPEKKKFMASVTNAINQIKQKKLKKIVLSYMDVISFKKSFEPINLIEKMKNENCTNYHFQMKNGSSIFGTSPEKLFNKNNQNIRTEALAGSNISKDNFLSSDKDLHEHQIVVEHITKSLKTICKKIIYKNTPNIKSHNKLFHLNTKISGNLNKDINPLLLIKKIHPTPAVCGMPTSKAIKQINKLEKTERGWYTGVIGWLDFSMNADFIVNLRSGFYDKNCLYLFGGAGIVEESNPMLEWEEIKNKIDTIKGLLIK